MAFFKGLEALSNRLAAVVIAPKGTGKQLIFLLLSTCRACSRAVQRSSRSAWLYTFSKGGSNTTPMGIERDPKTTFQIPCSVCG
jgi:hypothetical protein